MQFVSKLSPEQWAEARRLRAEGATYPELSVRFGVTANNLGKRARKEGWAWPVPGDAPGGSAKVRRPSPATFGSRRRLALHLYGTIEFRIRMMEFGMQKRLETLEHNPGAEPPGVTKEECDSFAALIAMINQVTEMASEPASAAPGRRKSAINPELGALSDELDAAGLAAASEKDESTARLAEQLAKVVGPA